MKFRQLMFAVGLIVTVAMALPMHAQTGCVDSPEDPTVVLALMGGVGTLAMSLARFNKRRP